MRLGLLIALITTCATATRAQTATWQRTQYPSDSTLYRIEGDGLELNAPNTVLRLQALRMPPPQSWAAFNLFLRADSLAYRSATFSAEIRTVDASEGVTLTAVAGGSGGRTLESQNTRNRPVRGTADWTPVALTLRIAPGSTQLLFALQLNGAGLAVARNVQVRIGPAETDALSPLAQEYLDSAVAVVKRTAYWSDTVSWARVEADVRSLARGSETAVDVYPAIRHLLLRLGDHHSFFKAPPTVSSPTPATDTPRSAFTPVDVLALGDRIAVIRMPGYTSSDPSVARAYVADVYTKLLNAAPRAKCGWILDLRDNGGGNMFPMLAGLAPFLGTGPLGSFMYRSGRSTSPWHARQPTDAALPAELLSLEPARVAVITGSGTSSAGEAVTIAFRGRSNTRSFGQPTDGLSNANQTIRLSDGATIAVMAALDVDRDGNVYGTKVDPDERTDARNGDRDPALDQARAWLQHACRDDR